MRYKRYKHATHLVITAYLVTNYLATFSDSKSYWFLQRYVFTEVEMIKFSLQTKVFHR